MNTQSQPQLSGVPETLLISLNARCYESIHPRGLIKDTKSIEITEKLGYDFRKSKSVMLTNIGTAMRTIVLNRYTEDFLRRFPDGTVVNIACGLDTRFHRLDNGRVRWFDLDFPEVIAIRRRFFTENERYTFIEKSVLDFSWTEQIPKNKPVFLTAEGLSCYLTEEENRSILVAIAKAFPKAEIAIEAIAPFMVKKSQHHPSLQGYNARFKWGINSGKELDAWNTGFKFVDEYFFMKMPECKRRSFIIRLLDLMPAFAKSMKIFRLRNYEES